MRPPRLPVELDPVGVGEALHFFRRQHPRHQLRAVRVVRVDVGRRLAPILQPVCIILISSSCEISIRFPSCFISSRLVRDGMSAVISLSACVMADHLLHEPDIGGRVADAGQVDRLLDRDDTRSWPGAPGWTIGAADPTAALRHAVARKPVTRTPITTGAGALTFA